jgi:hypothetical protein
MKKRTMRTVGKILRSAGLVTSAKGKRYDAMAHFHATIVPRKRSVAHMMRNMAEGGHRLHHLQPRSMNTKTG